MKTPLLVTLAVLALAAPQAAHAQYQMTSPLLYEGPRISYDAHVAASGRGGTSSPNAVPSIAGPAASAAALRYQPDLSLRQTNLDTVLSRVRSGDRDGARQMEQIFAQGDVIERLSDELRPLGFRTDDLGDVFAVWWINVWQASRGRDFETSATANAAVRAQARAALTTTPGIADLDDADKQRFAESLLVQAALVGAALKQAGEDPAKAPALTRGATQLARRLGLEPSTMELTDQGFQLN